MPHSPDGPLLDALLDSWDRNNTILVNLLLALPEDTMMLRAMDGSPTFAQLFAHMHYVRLVFIAEDAPEFARALPEQEWSDAHEQGRLAEMLRDSAAAVRDAVRHRISLGSAMEQHYDHPLLLLQHMLWHEGYHYGQIKLALKLAGRPMANADAGPISWRVWMNKTTTA